MIGQVTILDAIRATAGAVGLVERMSNQMEQALSATNVPKGMGTCRPTIRADGEVLFSSMRGEVLQRITGEALLRLPETSIRRMFVLERAIQNHYEDWVRIFPKVKDCSEPFIGYEGQHELRRVVAAMQDDVEEVMAFLEKAGFTTDGHCAYLRNVIRTIGGEGTTGMEGFNGTGLSHT